jgi:putative hydrolase of the HAD superfamily
MIKAIFFDAAGTLFVPVEPIGRSYARIARGFGVEADERAVADGFRRAFARAGGLAFGPGIPPGELRQLERRWWRECVRESFAGLGSFEDFDRYFDVLFAYFAEPSSWRAAPGAGAVLADLHARGLILGVVSNFDGRLHAILEGLDLRRYFDSVTISSEAGYAKPAPEIFAAAMARHGVAPTETIHVGDSEPLDVGGATAAGIATILVDPKRRGAPEVGGRVARVSSLAEAAAFIGRPPFS